MIPPHHTIPPPLSQERFEGCLLGLMVGDALGLPREGVGPRRAARMFPPPLRHALIWNRGLTSDDTDHACMTAQALLVESRDPNIFARSLAWRMRGWLLTLPAGIGFATLRSIIKLWIGFPPRLSGVFSAGNGPAMRAPVIGLFFASRCSGPEEFNAAAMDFIMRSTRLTHTDPKAARAAAALAWAVIYASRRCPDTFSASELLDNIEQFFPPDDREAARYLAEIRLDLAARREDDDIRQLLNCGDGVSGYIYHTFFAVLAVWLRAPFCFADGMERLMGWGGDADTTGAVYGALAGAAAGSVGIPEEWLKGIVDKPRSVSWVRSLSRVFYSSSVKRSPERPLPLAWWQYFARTPLYWALILAHAIRRILPPY